MAERITTQEAARRLGFSVTHVHRLISGSGGCRKRLDGVKNSSGEWLISESSVRDFELYRNVYRRDQTFRTGYVSIQEAAERIGFGRDELLAEIYRSGNGQLVEWEGNIPMIHEFNVKAWEASRKG